MEGGGETKPGPDGFSAVGTRVSVWHGAVEQLCVSAGGGCSVLIPGSRSDSSTWHPKYAQYHPVYCLLDHRTRGFWAVWVLTVERGECVLQQVEQRVQRSSCRLLQSYWIKSAPGRLLLVRTVCCFSPEFEIHFTNSSSTSLKLKRGCWREETLNKSYSRVSGCWFVSRIQQKLLNRFPQNSDGGRVSAQNRPR